MRRLARLLARLYPCQWRARYGEEFEALLEDASLRSRDVFGVLAAAFEMRMKTWQGERHCMIEA
jgi:hypothetical protein